MGRRYGKMKVKIKIILCCKQPGKKTVFVSYNFVSKIRHAAVARFKDNAPISFENSVPFYEGPVRNMVRVNPQYPLLNITIV